MERRLAVVLVLVAVAITAVLALAPMGQVSTCTTDGCSTETTSLFEHEGRSVLVVLAIPVAVAALAVVLRTRRARMVLAGLLTVFAVLGMLTIGLFLLPVVGLLWALAFSTSAA